MTDQTLAVDWLRPNLTGWANYLWARFGGAPVYLHGSALTRPDPRDVDITIVVPDAMFARRYGGEAFSDLRHTNNSGLCEGLRRCYREAAGLAFRMQASVSLPLDLKITLKITSQAIDSEYYRGAPRVRLDEFEEAQA